MKKLKLHKETLRYLKDAQVRGVAGGASTAASGCTSCSPSSCLTQCCNGYTLPPGACQDRLTIVPCNYTRSCPPPLSAAC